MYSNLGLLALAAAVGLAAAPVAQAQDNVVVRPGVPGGNLYAPPAVDLDATSPGRPGKPASYKPSSHASTHPTAGAAPAPLAMCSTLLCDAPGQSQDAAFLLASRPLWCLGPLYDGRCLWPKAASPTTGSPTAPTPRPAVLAQQAAQRLRLPLPMPRHSPDLRLPDDRSATVVGEHTWFWTDPADWRPQRERVQAGAVWAEATAVPVRLSMVPGMGQPTEFCAGPGTPYDRSFGLHAASPDCDVVYERSSMDQPGEQVTAQWSITWRVVWRGWDGSAPVGGELAPMTSRAPARFAVAEAQALRTR